MPFQCIIYRRDYILENTVETEICIEVLISLISLFSFINEIKTTLKFYIPVYYT